MHAHRLKQGKKEILQMNASKTKLMTNAEASPVTIDNAPVDHVKEYVYIGQLVSVANAMDKVIKRRVALAWGKFHSLSTIPKTKV